MSSVSNSATVCIANIGPRERRKRMRFGVALLTVGAALAVFLWVLGAHRPWRLALFLPLWAGAIGIFQAREKT